MVDVFSIHVRIWNTETYQNHLKKEGVERGRIMEGMSETGVHCIHM
jgi:hypothetical protein